MVPLAACRARRSSSRAKVVDMDTAPERTSSLTLRADLLALVARWTTNAVVIPDPLGRIEWVNDGFVRLTGYSLSEVQGRKPGSFLQGPETDPEVVATMRAHSARGEGFQVEVVNYSKNGIPYWLLIDVQPVRNA